MSASQGQEEQERPESIPRLSMEAGGRVAIFCPVVESRLGIFIAVARLQRLVRMGKG